MAILEKIRKPILVLVMSVAGLGGIAVHEGYRDKAYIPVPGDVPTIGYGSTTYEDGSKVKLGDTITRKRADELLGNKVNMFEKQVKSCVKVPLTQTEYTAYVSLTYNIGGQAFCNSTLVKKLNAYDYEGACKEILKWDKFRGNSLPGLTKRRQQEYKLCSAQ
jgi:lysozyme